MTALFFPPTPAADASAQDVRLLESERTICVVRALATIFAVIQILTYYIPYPAGIEEAALVIVVLLLVGNFVFAALLRQPLSGTELRKVSIESLLFDLVIVMAFVFLYTFDVNTAIWAAIYMLPLGGAMRFQFTGAIAVTLAATVLYVIREIYGYYQYGNEIFISSITFRMGIGLIIAYVAGTTASRLLDERNVVEEANTELSELNSSIRDFVAIASHDMRTPLTVVGGLSSYMVDNWDSIEDAKKVEYLKAVDRQTKFLVRLVNDLLTASNIDAGTTNVQPTDVNVTDLARRVWGSVPEAGPANIEGDQSLTVYADESHVERALVNLLSNAVKYGAPPIKLDAARQAELVEIRVEDAGPGVPIDFLPRLFDRFARPSGATIEDGTGLGLSIVKGLIEANGGSVAYSTNKTTGAIFSIRLPANAP